MVPVRRVCSAWLIVVLLVSARPSVGQARAETPLTISKATYYDKTLAGILGQVGGFLSGYEFVQEEPMPDEWFRLTYGPYSGDSPYWKNTTYPGYDRLFADGRVGSDDDYHIDFFNQLILDTYGPTPTYKDILDAWVKHQVSDWGGGDSAMQAMINGLLPPMTGKAEYNPFYWVSEPYIETETLGMVAPGMPRTARDLDQKFASVVGDFDSVIWAKMWAVAYSLAYFETDSRVVLDKAALTLPANTWPYQMYLKVKALHDQNPNNWRWAQHELRKVKRLVYRQDNIMVIPDINNALGMMAILYGENDYLKTAQIASLSGYDADCTAAAVTGLMGILKGMDGTPQAIKTRIYADGKGVYINDTQTGYKPFISFDYPTEQPWTSIAALYQRNAERQIVAQGGQIDGDQYRITPQPISPPSVVLIPNYDFEDGSLNGWQGSPDNTPPAHIFAEPNESLTSVDNMAQSGYWKGRIVTDKNVPSARLFTVVKGLQPGQTYRARAYLQTDNLAQFFVRPDAQTELSTDVVLTTSNLNREWVERTLEFTATSDTATIGLAVPDGKFGASAIDNLYVEPITIRTLAHFDANTKLDKPGAALSYDLDGLAAGEYWLRIRYANGGDSASQLNLLLDGKLIGAIPFPQTAAFGQQTQNSVRVPLALTGGKHTLRLEKGDGPDQTEIGSIEIRAGDG